MSPDDAADAPSIADGDDAPPLAVPDRGGSALAWSIVPVRPGPRVAEPPQSGTATGGASSPSAMLGASAASSGDMDRPSYSSTTTHSIIPADGAGTKRTDEAIARLAVARVESG